jgi:hypothetical protein
MSENHFEMQLKELKRRWVWWCMSVIPALKRLRQEVDLFMASLAEKEGKGGGRKGEGMGAREKEKK